MLSAKLVQLIESHWEEIATRLIVSVRSHPDLPQLARTSDMDLREWCRQILENLGYLLSASRDEELQRRFQVLGRIRYQENVPLHEAVLRTQLLKEKITGFIHEQGFPMSAMHLYAEEELELRVGRFFDGMVYNLVRGYERAQDLDQRVA